MVATCIDLWREFAASTGPRRDLLRNALAGKYLYIAKQMAGMVLRHTRGRADYDDLLQDAAMGLLNAIERFEPERGMEFSTYGGRRVRGAILDGLRVRQGVPRLATVRAKKVAVAREQIRQEIGQEPSDWQIAQRLGIAMSLFRRWQAQGDAAIRQTVSVFRSRDHATREYDHPRDLREIDAIAARQQEGTGIRSEWLRGLSREERLIVTLYYAEDLSMKQIGAAIGITESGVSNKHKSILARLRVRAHDERKEFANA